MPLKVVTYTTVSSSLVALLITFLLLAILRKLRSNLHSIHKNLVAAIFLSELIFLTGINQTDSPVSDHYTHCNHRLFIMLLDKVSWWVKRLREFFILVKN